MKTHLLVIGMILQLSFSLNAQNKLQTGTAAPDIKFSHCVNAKVDTNFYKGKTVVLEFWATWCAPCIAGFPHLNELSEKLSSSEVLFLSMTREKEIEKIKSVLDKRPLKAYNLVDNNSITSAKFAVESLPQTFVIGKNGTLLWNGYFSDLTPGLLEKLITTQTPANPSTSLTNNSETFPDRFIFKVNYSANQEITGFGESFTNTDADKYGRFGWECKEWSFKNLLGSQLNRFSPMRTKSNRADFNIDLEFFCDTTLLPNSPEFLKASLATLFNVEVKTEKRDTMAWTVKVIDEHKLLSAKSNGAKSSTGVNKKEFIFMNQSFKNICTFFEYRLKDFFEFDENVMTGMKFDISIPFATTIEEINKSLGDKYGFVFTSMMKQIQILEMDFK